MWICPICSNQEKSKYICSECGFDNRSDYLKHRTIAAVSKEDVDYRKRIACNIETKKALSEALARYDELNKKYEHSKKEIELLRKIVDNDKELNDAANKLIEQLKERVAQKESLIENLKQELETQKKKTSISYAKSAKEKQIYSSGDWYEGELKNGLRHGKGIYQYANGDHYEGGFSEGKFDGYGIITYKNTGNRFEGNYVKGSRQGKGTFYYAGGTVVQGEWKDGKLVYGKETYSDGNW